MFFPWNDGIGWEGEKHVRGKNESNTHIKKQLLSIIWFKWMNEKNLNETRRVKGNNNNQIWSDVFLGLQTQGGRNKTIRMQWRGEIHPSTFQKGDQKNERDGRKRRRRERAVSGLDILFIFLNSCVAIYRSSMISVSCGTRLSWRKVCVASVAVSCQITREHQLI